MKLSTALAAAKHFGYAGKDDDINAVRAVLVANAKSIENPGGPVDWNTEPIEDDTVRKTYSIPKTGTVAADPANQPGSLPADFEARMNAAVEARLKALGLADVKALRPDMRGGRDYVKSFSERMYEDRIAAKSAVFRDYDTARGAQLWLKHKIGQWTGNPELANEGRKALGEWGANKAFDSQTATQGASFVPTMFLPDVIKLVNTFGVARQLARVVPMSGPELVIPRLTGGVTGGLTMYFPLENAAGTTSDLSTDVVQLNANTGLVNCVVSQQAIDDSSIGLVDLFFEQMARACASGEDTCYFTANGEAANGKMIGIARKFGTVATDGGYVSVGAGTADAHTQAQLVAAFGRLPAYVQRGGNIKITCTPVLQAAIFTRLSTSTGVGGLTRSDVDNGGPTFNWMNIPIVVNNTTNTRIDASTGTQVAGFTSGDDIDFMIGDFAMASKFGDRMQIQLDMNPSRGFDTYSVYLRAVDRFDVNVHDVGTSSAAGPVVSFWQT